MRGRAGTRTGWALRVHANLFAPLDLYDAAVMDSDFDGPEIESVERLNDVLDELPAANVLRYVDVSHGKLVCEEIRPFGYV